MTIWSDTVKWLVYNRLVAPAWLLGLVTGLAEGPCKR